MDQRYPNATAEELSAMSDRTCIICREEMVLISAQDSPAPPDGPNTTPKKLPCGHIFHFYCLRSWLERQQSCPTCRRNVLDDVQPNVTQAPPPQPLPVNNAQQANNLVAPEGVNPPNPPNPLGFLGRLFGPPARVGNAPGRQRNQPPRNAAGQPLDQQGQGIFINYQVQYQFPRNEANPVNQQLQELPLFPGFNGPDGVWQPWPAHPGHEEDQPVPPSDAPFENLSSPEEATEIPNSSIPPDENQISPREAAALAALKRLGKSTAASSKITPPPVTQPTPMNGSSTSVQSVVQPISPITVPQLIPNWYLRPSLSQSARRVQPPVLNHAPSYRDNETPLARLPPTLTDEQLASLDRLTRDTIDERLRILEGVSGAIYRSIDDLMRLRSALPLEQHILNNGAATVSPPETSTQPMPTDEQVPVETIPSSHAKEKMRETSSPNSNEGSWSFDEVDEGDSS